MRFMLLILFLVGCGSEKDTLEIDPQLEPIFSEYLAKAPSEGRLSDFVSLQYGDTNGALGRCFSETPKTMGVKTGKKQWKININARLSKQPWRLKATVFHELGHCLHQLDHVQELGAIMEESTWVGDQENYWQGHFDQKVSEMWK